MDDPVYEFRVVIGGIPALGGWTANFSKARSHQLDLRELNAREIIYLEISPWFWYKNPEDKRRWKWECPGCQYAACPSNEFLSISPRK